MTDRERWTVYPLLILALGLALHDKLLSSSFVDAQRVTCRELIVKGRDGTTVMQATAGGDGGGRILVFGGTKKPNVLVEASKGGGTIQLIGDEGHILADLGHDDSGNGHLVLLGEGDELVVLGDDDHDSGKVVVFGPENHACVALTVETDKGNGQVRTYNIEGVAQVILESTNGGGQLFTVSDEKKPLIAIQHDGAGSGSILMFDATGAAHPVVFARAARPRIPGIQNPANDSPEPAEPGAEPQSEENSDPASDPDEDNKPPADSGAGPEPDSERESAPTTAKDPE